MITPTDFERAVGYVKRADCRSFATLDATAKMLGVRKFDVMTYLEQNPKLVVCSEHHDSTQVVKPSYRPFDGKRIGRHYETRITKRYGLCIDDAFASVEENPFNDEWLEKTMRQYEKTVWISAWDNYGQIEGHYLAEDARPSSLPSGEVFKDHRKNTFLWRNTAEKLAQCKALGATFKKTFYFGGLGDCSSHEVRYAVDAEGVKKLEAAGWTVIGKWQSKTEQE